MIPATKPVAAFDPATGERLRYDQWTPTEITLTRTGEGAMAAVVKMQRSRLLAGGNTDLLSEATSARVGRPTATVLMTVPNIYAAASEEYPPPLRDLILKTVAPALIGAVAALADVRGVR